MSGQANNRNPVAVYEIVDYAWVAGPAGKGFGVRCEHCSEFYHGDTQDTEENRARAVAMVTRHCKVRHGSVLNRKDNYS